MLSITQIIVALLILIILFFIYEISKSFGSFNLKKHLNNGSLPNSIHYKNGVFHNVVPVKQMKDGIGFKDVFKKLINGKPPRAVPTQPIPNKPISEIDLSFDQFIWFGHSSYLLVLDGKTFLIDPVFSKSVSPLGIGIGSFKMQYQYSTQDLPPIDYLIITHDHWDHLDYRTVKALKPKVKHILTGLGIGAHLIKWGFTKNIISELDWWNEIQLGEYKITSTPAQHFAGRGLIRNNTLWSSFIVESSNQTIYIGGDSGYGPHFKEIGQKFNIDWALLENGQYDPYWPYIHMNPHECILAGNDLQTKFAIPIHNSKFALAFHDWDAPMRNLLDFQHEASFQLVLPQIGEIVHLNKPANHHSNWWDF